MTAVSESDRFTLRTMLVRQVRWEAEGVVSVELGTVDGSPAPTWTPGGHIDLVLPSGLVRQYSLCGQPGDRTGLTVAVLREADGRGGSREVHETQLVGRTVQICGPRNHFRLGEAEAYLLIAGGIGITPLLAMARELDARGATWRMVYGGRSRATMAFLDELTGSGGLGGTVTIVPEDEAGLPDVAGILDEAAPGAEVYCCGPEGLIGAVEAAGADRGVPVHVERFASGAAPAVADADAAAVQGLPEGSFRVELRASGITVDVAAGRSILETVRERLPEVVSSCEEGYCGSCETRVLAGEPDHRDQVLDEDEREAGESMMICVGRSRTDPLVLDL